MHNMRPEELAMLVCGVVLFVASIVVLAVLLMKSKPLSPAYALFFFAIVMIGYPSIKSFTFAGGSFEKDIDDFGRKPNDPEARENFNRTLNAHLEKPETKPLSSGTVSNLTDVINALGSKTNLSAESRMTLSKAQLVLGKTNEAAATLNVALKSNSQLAVDPKLKFLLKK